MRSRRPRTPRRAWLPLAVLAMLALVLGFALPAHAAQSRGAIRVVEVSPDGELKGAPTGLQPADLDEILAYLPDGMALPPELEPNDSAATANLIPGNESVILGNITPVGDADYFSFSALAGDRVYAALQTQFSNASGDSQLELFATDGTTRIEFDDDDGSFGSLSSVIAGAVIPSPGTYYLRVDGFSATTTLITPYHLHFALKSGAPTAEVEPNNTTATANPLPVNGWVNGDISATTDPDFFSFSLNAGESVFISLDANPERDANRWDPRVGEGVFNNFILVAGDAGAGSATDEAAEAFFMTAKEAGTYYAYVDSTVATGLGPNATYQMVVRIIPKEAQVSCTTVPAEDTPVALGPAVGTSVSSIVVPASMTGTITDVNVLLRLTHANMVDLDVSLASPAATSVQLFTDVGSSTQPGMNLGLDDNAALPIGSYTVVTGMINQPEGGAGAGRLATFNGEAAAGTWTLSLADDLAANGGSLAGWSLEVCGPPTPPFAVTMWKTVSLDPAVCGTTPTLTVPPGTTVYYCYTVTNWGATALTTHDLVDDQLGTIFSGVAFNLAPGSSIDTVALGLTIPAQLQATTTNTATWTAHNGPDSASDSASATVTVPTRCGPGYRDVTLTFSDFAGGFPPAGWTLANTTTACTPPGVPDWTNTNPGARANLTGGVGAFAIADSDRCGSGSSLNATMTTPPMDLTGMIDPQVHFAMDFRALAPNSATVEASTDGGTTWTPIQSWTTDARGPLAIDAAIPGAGTAGVLVRWNYTSTWSWWWEVDDAWVTACEELIPEIALTKTVGDVPAVCAATDNITVTTGTPVYYCYTVENTGDYTFNFHDLDDDVLGVILDDFPYVLNPGDTAEVIVPDVATAPVTNTATWTATTALPGYVVDDTIPYDFVDISGTGTSFTLADDEVSAALPIGFTFNFFGSDYADAYASSNGFLTLLAGQDSGCCTGQPMPTPGDPDAVIAAWWEDLDPGEAGAGLFYQTLGSAPNRVFVVQFTNVQHFPSGTAVTFQYKLFEGSNAIEVHYQAAPSDGGTHAAGIEDATGAAGNQYFLGTTGLTTPLAVRYSIGAPPLSASATDSATVNIADPDIELSVTELGSFQPVDTQVIAPFDISNVGVADLDWQIAEDAGLVGGRFAALPGRQQPIRAHVRDTLPMPDADLAKGTESFSRASGATGEVATPERGEAPDATVTITHSATQNLVSGNSVACNNGIAHTDNSYIRRFTLADFGINGDFAVTQVEIGIEQATGAGGSQPATMNLYTWNPADPFTFANFVPIGTANATVPDQSLTIITVPVSGVAPAGSTLVVEFFTPNGQAVGNLLFVGSNPDGQTSPTFLAAVDCGVADPTDTAVLGFPGMHLVMNVTGNTGCDADLPWVSASPGAGVTLPGGTDTVDVTFDSTGLVPGAVYTGGLCVQSNDPDEGELVIPLTLEVDGMPFLGDFEEGDTSDWTLQVP